VSARIEETPRNRRGYWEARPGDVIGRSELLFVDVRPDPRTLVGDFGHIHGVTHVPAEEVLGEGLVGIATDTPVVLVCENGRTSARCAEALVRQHGFTEVYHLVGGMLRWVAEARPVARKPTYKVAAGGR
jgi:rhodanese-related sulfurtransferase